MKSEKISKYSNRWSFSKADRKGFTLIELLAVIIILGVLMIIAIPSVTEYISSARKDSYIVTLSNYVQSVRVKTLSLAYDQMPSFGEALLVPFDKISLEKGGDSPFGEFDDEKSYIILINDGDGYSYYINSLDAGGFRLRGVRSLYLSTDVITSDSNIAPPESINNVKSGTKVKIDGATLTVSNKNKASSDYVLLDVTYDNYDIGESVTLVDGSAWYVIDDDYNKVTLISNGLLDMDGNLTWKAGAYKTMFDGTTNKTTIYYKNIPNSVADILENKFRNNFYSSLKESHGSAYVLDVSLLSPEKLVEILEMSEYYDRTIHNVKNGNDGVQKAEFIGDLTTISQTKISLKNALLRDYYNYPYFLEGACTHEYSEDMGWNWIIGYPYQLRYTGIWEASNVEGYIRPVVTILKSNIKI